MPEGFRKHLLGRRGRSARGEACPHGPAPRQLGKVPRGYIGLLFLGAMHATVFGEDPAPVTAPNPTPAPVHITDEQDRILPADLSRKQEDKSSANALYAQAMLLREGQSGELAKALDILRQVVALDPHFPDAQVKIANLLLQGGQLEPAFAQLKAATTANPDSIDIEMALGYVQHLRGQNEEARVLCTKVLAQDPTQAPAMRVLLEMAGDQGDLVGGVNRIEAMLDAAGTRATSSAWLALGRLYLEVARGDVHAPGGEALLKILLPIYQRAAALPPPEVETLSLLADTYRDLDRLREALKTLQQAIALDPSNVDIILRCAALQTDLGQKAEALKNYEEAYALNPDLTGLREMLGRVYLEHKRFEDAIRLLQEARANAPHDPGLGIDLGFAYEGAHRDDQAQACFQEILNSEGCPPEAYLKLAEFQLTHDQSKAAAATLAEGWQRFPKSAKIRFYQAIQFRYQKEYPAALACLDEAHALDTGADAGVLGVNYYLENAETLDLAGKKDRLEKTLREGLAQYPDSADLMNELAYFLAEEHRYLPEALDLSGRAAALEPDNGPITDTRGWVYFQMGRAKDALPYLQRAAVLTDNDPVVLQHLGDAYLKLGLRSEALASWRRGLEKAPHNGDLATRINAAQAQANNAHPRSAPNP